MSSSHPNGDDTRSGNGRFEQTQWTIILKARKEGDPEAAEAMDTFARTYWPAIYRYIRRDGYHSHDAEDLTQGFYAHFLGKQLLNGVGERTGRFRNYLLTCLKHFLSEKRDHAKALKRGGDKVIISRDAVDVEECDALEPTDNLTPERAFDQRWARTLLDLALETLRDEYQVKGQADVFEALKEVPLGGKADARYADIARSLEKTEQAVKSAANRLRSRYGEILRAEIRRTVSDPSQTNEEIRHLMEILGN